MFQALFSDEAARRRHRNAPFADERAQYLRYCADQGATRATLRVKSSELLWLAKHLDPCVSQGIDLEELQEIVCKRVSIYKGATTAETDRYCSTVATVHGLVARASH
jgi:integrase/recombinase XerD